jgi:hypothetical protein
MIFQFPKGIFKQRYGSLKEKTCLKICFFIPSRVYKVGFEPGNVL